MLSLCSTRLSSSFSLSCLRSMYLSPGLLQLSVGMERGTVTVVSLLGGDKGGVEWV